MSFDLSDFFQQLIDYGSSLFSSHADAQTHHCADSHELADHQLPHHGHDAQRLIDLTHDCRDSHQHYDSLPHISIAGEPQPIELGLDHPEKIAGFQGNSPHCGIHSVGNVVQAFHPGTGEGINAQIYEMARQANGLTPALNGYALHPMMYKPILEQAYQIPCNWYSLSADQLLEPLGQGRVAVMIGDAYSLDPTFYKQPGLCHAFNITGFKFEHGNLILKGTDSNFPDKEMYWPIERVRESLRGSWNMGYRYNTLLSDAAVPKT